MSSTLASVLLVRKRRARAFGQPFGLPDLPFFAWPKKGRPKKGHPSSAPFAHPCAQGSRESVGVRGQAVPGLSRTSAASLRPPLRADPRTPAAPQGPREERGLLPAGATATAKSQQRRANSEAQTARSTQRGAEAQGLPSAAQVFSKALPAQAGTRAQRACLGTSVLRSSGRYVSAAIGVPAGLDRLPQRRSRLGKALAPLNPR